MGRILAVDYGERRVGLALSDENAILVSTTPPTLDRKALPRGQRLEAAIARIVEEWEVAEVVLGLPINMDGSQGEAAQKVIAFGAVLKAALGGVPVNTWDERLTSVAAQRVRAELGIPLTKRRDKGKVDSLAAVILLQNYLAWKRGGGGPAEADPD